MIYKERRIEIRFVTPTFLGGALGASELRTPPFKSLLRRWWRVVRVRGSQPDVRRLREREGRLFGHTFLKHQGIPWASASRVRLAIDGWRSGNLQKWNDNDPQIEHPEVERARGKIGAHLYLGYGPLGYDRGTVLKTSAAFSADTSFSLVARVHPSDERDLALDEVLRLWHYFGTVGSRSRNGWGSLEVDAAGKPPIPEPSWLTTYSRQFEDCLDSDWSHAIGRDSKGLLLWRTKVNYDSWQRAMQELARVKVRFRTRLQFNKKDCFERRHLVAYPVTHHEVREWKGEESFRLANQIRFKVLRETGVTDGPKRYFSVALHMPHGLPREMLNRLSRRDQDQLNQAEVWRAVHACLDQEMRRWN
jgi:CRISPR-associated protein Cmr1